MKKIIIPILLSMLSVSAMAQTTQKVLYIDGYYSTGTNYFSVALPKNADDKAYPVINFKTKKFVKSDGVVSLSRIKEFKFRIVEEEVTAINEIKKEKDDDKAPVFNLSGQRVTTPAKGIYIKNGKKYIVK